MSKPRVLFLDDMETRHQTFVRATVHHEVELVRVYSAEDAIRELSTGEFHQVFLDHDLSIDDILVEVGGATKFPTGMDVVDYICTMTEPPRHIVVHSCNPPAATEMCRRLRSVEGVQTLSQIPFPHLLSDIQF